ncbi:MAG: hypothetical protein KDB27_13490 [Planctomycetales bacterium]|nr:hypothetical protein [Planctomycetales bacterium]
MKQLFVLVVVIVGIGMTPLSGWTDLVVNSSGEEATWIYNQITGNLTLRSETTAAYTGFALQTNLFHFDTVKIDPDYTTRFLPHANPGFNNPFGGIVDANTLSFVLFTTDPTCADCLRGTTDMGNVMVPGLTESDIADNWRSLNAFHPSGGFDSDRPGEMTKFGVIVVPEPSAFLQIGILGIAFAVQRIIVTLPLRKHKT